jgi:hypothetical protein
MVSGFGKGASATGAGPDFSATVCPAVNRPYRIKQQKVILRFQKFISSAAGSTLKSGFLGSESWRDKFLLSTSGAGFGVFTVSRGVCSLRMTAYL